MVLHTDQNVNIYRLIFTRVFLTAFQNMVIYYSWKHTWILMTKFILYALLGVLPSREVHIWAGCEIAVSNGFSNCGTCCILLCLCCAAFDG